MSERGFDAFVEGVMDSPDRLGAWVRQRLMAYTARLPARLITIGGKPYLERYHVMSLPGGREVYLHRFVSSDGERHVHDHPFRGIAVILVGGYLEDRLVHLNAKTGGQALRVVRRSPLGINFIGLRTFHRIALTDRNTWTLFVRGKRRKGWGMLDPVEGGGVLYMPMNSHDQPWYKGAPLGAEVGREK